MVRIGSCFRPLFDDLIVQQHQNEWQKKKKNGARAAVNLFTAAVDVIPSC